MHHTMTPPGAWNYNHAQGKGDYFGWVAPPTPTLHWHTLLYKYTTWTERTWEKINDSQRCTCTLMFSAIWIKQSINKRTSHSNSSHKGSEYDVATIYNSSRAYSKHKRQPVTNLQHLMHNDVKHISTLVKPLLESYCLNNCYYPALKRDDN